MRAALSSMIAAFWILATPYTYGQTPEDTIWVGNIELVLGMQEDALVRKFAEQYRLQKMEEGKIGFNSWVLTSKTGPPYRLYANVSFEEGRLSSVVKYWVLDSPQTGADVAKAVYGVIDTFVKEGRTACRIDVRDSQSPEIESRATLINCGRKTLSITWAWWSEQGESASVQEILKD